jgi:GT2 family glycosyltransferase
MAPAKCSIVIPAYNAVDLTEQCLRVILESTPDGTFEIIVVDNASTDGTAEMLAAFGERVRILANTENLGFSRACNQGAKAAAHPVVLFLNNDTLVQEGWLPPLAEVLGGEGAAAVAGSRLIEEDGLTIQSAGFAVRHDDMPVMLYRGFPPLEGIGDRRRRMQAVSGACLAVRREVFLELGGFDVAFLNGYEDLDFCLKVCAGGMEVWYVPESRVVHLEGSTAGRFEREDGNRRLFRERWRGRVRRDILELLREDGFDVINPKSRDLVLMRDGMVFSVTAGNRCRVERLPDSRAARALRVAALRARHLPARIKYGRLLDEPRARPARGDETGES